jgi:hypothetical protein
MVVKLISTIGVLVAGSYIYNYEKPFSAIEYCETNFDSAGHIMELRQEYRYYPEGASLEANERHNLYDEYSSDVIEELVDEAYETGFAYTRLEYRNAVRLFESQSLDICLNYFSRKGFNTEKEKDSGIISTIITRIKS